jgi:type IV conjugative transfer system lipoprotein TraV
MKKTLFAGAAVLALTGCMSTPKHECALDETGGHCASLEQAYQAASGLDDVSGYQNVFESTKKAGRQGTQGFAPEGYAQPAERGKPVFVPPKVHRVWTSPWTDSEGQLHGGEYLYFTTPGKWSYGSLRAPGEASGVFKPVLADTYGFTPVVAKKVERNDSAVKAAAQIQAEQAAATKTINGVTQPQDTQSE